MASKKKSVTMHDVAAFAGVSVKTVSNVVNDGPYVTDETRHKVAQAIAVVGYRPNHLARSLVTGKTNAIGIVVPDVANPFFGRAFRGCEDVLLRAGYSIFLCNTNEDLDRERYYLNQLLSRRIDALILWGSRLGCPELQETVGTDLVLVTVELGEAPTAPNHICINVDNVAGARAATAHLVQAGHRTIAHLAGPAGRITAALRRQGYCQALEAAGIEASPQHITADHPSIRGGLRSMRRLLEFETPEAIFCYNDLMAFGALLAARQAGLVVPDDLAVVGFDDIDMASMIDPPLTSVRIPQYQLGRLAGQSILDRLEDGESGREVVTCPVELQIRGSSATKMFTDENRKQMWDDLVSAMLLDAVD